MLNPEQTCPKPRVLSVRPDLKASHMVGCNSERSHKHVLGGITIVGKESSNLCFVLFFCSCRDNRVVMVTEDWITWGHWITLARKTDIRQSKLRAKSEWLLADPPCCTSTLVKVKRSNNNNNTNTKNNTSLVQSLILTMALTPGSLPVSFPNTGPESN